VIIFTNNTRAHIRRGRRETRVLKASCERFSCRPHFYQILHETSRDTVEHERVEPQRRSEGDHVFLRSPRFLGFPPSTDDRRTRERFSDEVVKMLRFFRRYELRKLEKANVSRDSILTVRPFRNLTDYVELPLRVFPGLLRGSRFLSLRK